MDYKFFEWINIKEYCMSYFSIPLYDNYSQGVDERIGTVRVSHYTWYTLIHEQKREYIEIEGQERIDPFRIDPIKPYTEQRIIRITCKVLAWYRDGLFSHYTLKTLNEKDTKIIKTLKGYWRA